MVLYACMFTFFAGRQKQFAKLGAVGINFLYTSVYYFKGEKKKLTKLVKKKKFQSIKPWIGVSNTYYNAQY
jgi:hypothetical protein